MRLGRWGRTLVGKLAKERVGLRACTVVRPAVAEMALPPFTLCFTLTWCVAICSMVAAGVPYAAGEERFPSSSSSLVLSHPLTSQHCFMMFFALQLRPKESCTAAQSLRRVGDHSDQRGRLPIQVTSPAVPSSGCSRQPRVEPRELW